MGVAIGVEVRFTGGETRSRPASRRRGGGRPTLREGCAPTGQAGRITLWIADSPAWSIGSSRMTRPGPGAWIIMPFPE
ncbi:hypothetical protein GCM10022233_80080 [Streptomyces shaanxiensis]|uniref:ATP-binding protein n=1 Tax=Streptomyces shaanxiensis TaxID=653357 RepID=A0ABP7WC08_9ACTN